jgi:alkylation response protein AidB-like acyl-CoA dehydrogenase
MATTTQPPLEAARALAPEISARAQEAEDLRTVPLDLVDRIRAAGLFHLGVPEQLGGLECDPLTIFEVIEEVARADGSVGWSVFIGNSTSFIAWLDPVVAKEIVATRPDFISTGVFAPTGVARPDTDDPATLVVDGRWTFNSGCPHADWFMTGVVVMDGDGPRIVDGRPDWRFAFYPANEGEIVDTWHVAGLRGTGSHDVVAQGVRVPLERTIVPFFEPARIDRPLYRLPFAVLVSSFITAFPLGVARRALDEFTALAAKKSRSVPPGPTMADDEAVQVELARAESSVRAARAYVREALHNAYATVCAGDDVTMAQRNDVLMAGLNAGRAARAATDAVFAMAGGGALYDASPLQRCQRDLLAGTQHLFFSLGRWKAPARIQLGMDPGTFMI